METQVGIFLYTKCMEAVFLNYHHTSSCHPNLYYMDADSVISNIELLPRHSNLCGIGVIYTSNYYNGYYDHVVI